MDAASSGVVDRRVAPENARIRSPLANIWRQLLANFDQYLPEISHILRMCDIFGQVLANFGGIWSELGHTSGKVGHVMANVGRILPNVGQLLPIRAMFWQYWPSVGQISALGATFRQLRGNFPTTPELAGFGGGNFLGRVSCNFSATLGHLVFLFSLSLSATHSRCGAAGSATVAGCERRAHWGERMVWRAVSQV